MLMGVKILLYLTIADLTPTLLSQTETVYNGLQKFLQGQATEKKIKVIPEREIQVSQDFTT